MVNKIIAKFKALVAKPRKFTHARGFGDSTEHLEVVGNKVYVVHKDGSRSETKAYTLSDCLMYTKQGIWKEIK